jgi:hypothetical protein
MLATVLLALSKVLDFRIHKILNRFDKNKKLQLSVSKMLRTPECETNFAMNIL